MAVALPRPDLEVPTLATTKVKGCEYEGAVNRRKTNGGQQRSTYTQLYIHTQ